MGMRPIRGDVKRQVLTIAGNANIFLAASPYVEYSPQSLLFEELFNL
jgi:hypothetical protein